MLAITALPGSGNRGIDGSIDQAAKAIHLALAGKVHQLHSALLAGLEAYGGARRNVQPHAMCRHPVKASAPLVLRN